MGKIPVWKKKLKSIEELCYSMKRNAMIHDLDNPNQLQGIESSIEHLQEEMQQKVEEIEFEDETRCLFSLTKHRSPDVQYPSFSGLCNENFYKFQKEVEATFVANKVRREDKVKRC